MAKGEIVDIIISSKRGEHDFLDKFDLEVDMGTNIRFTPEDIPVTIFIPYPNQFFDTPETEYLEYTLDIGDEITLPPIRTDLEVGTEKEYQVFDRANNHFAWKAASSPPKIVIR